MFNRYNPNGTTSSSYVLVRKVFLSDPNFMVQSSKKTILRL
jgi:hypothetical protein